MRYLAKNLLYLRKLKGYTQAAMPLHVGVSGNTWGNYETGVSKPDLSKAFEIAKFFGVTLDDMIDVDMSENVHLTENLAVKKNGKNVHLNVHPNVHPTQNGLKEAPEMDYDNALKQEVNLLILRQLNTIATDVADIKAKLP